MSLQQRLDEIRADFKLNAPAEVARVMAQATALLIASGLAERSLKAGSRAPPFSLADEEGRTVASSELLARGPMVLSFFRGAWCPYCNLDLQAFQNAAAAMRERGASPVAISQQTVANSRRSQRENGLGFPVLSDPGGEVAAAFGLRWAIPEALRAAQRSLGADITLFNGESSWTLPMPARYVIDPDGVIVHAEVNPDYTRRPEVEAVLAVLERLARCRGLNPAGR